MIQLEKTSRIRKGKGQISILKDEEYSNTCMIECVGRTRKYKWTQEVLSIYGSYALLRDNYLIDLPGQCFLVIQINEHSKGGHIEHEIQLMNLKGDVLNKFSSKDNFDIILDNNRLWFLKSENKFYDFSNDVDIDLIQLHIKTGKTMHNIPLDYQKLLNCTYKRVFAAKLTEKRGRVMLKIQYMDDINRRQSKHIPLSTTIIR